VKLFLDSGAFIARARREDPHHEAAMDTFSGIARGELPYKLLYTSNYVIDETVTFLLYEAGPRVAVAVLRALRSSPYLVVLHVSGEVEDTADEFFARFASSRISYTDCTTKALMEQEAIDTAFAFDRDLEILGVRRIP